MDKDRITAQRVRDELDKAFRLGAATVSHSTTDVEQAVDLVLDGKMPHAVLGGRL